MPCYYALGRLSIAPPGNFRQSTVGRIGPAALGLVLLISGCGKPNYPISGTITLDGRPLPNATVSFLPESGKGAMAFAATNKAGRYTLRQKADTPGLPAGKYRVRVTTYQVNDAGKVLALNWCPAATTRPRN